MISCKQYHQQWHQWIECAQYNLLLFTQSGIKPHNSEIEPYFLWASVNQCSTGNMCVREGNEKHWYMHQKYNMTEKLSFCHQYICVWGRGMWSTDTCIKNTTWQKTFHSATNTSAVMLSFLYPRDCEKGDWAGSWCCWNVWLIANVRRLLPKNPYKCSLALTV